MSARLIHPISPIIVVFFKDFTGWTAIAQSLAYHAVDLPENDVLSLLRTYVLVVVQYPPPEFCVQIAEHDMHSKTSAALAKARLGSFSPEASHRLVSLIREALNRRFRLLLEADNAKSNHPAHLKEMRPLLADYRNSKTCLACLMRAPERMLTCGHSFCDICVRIFGRRDDHERTHYTFVACLMCEDHVQDRFMIMHPPTAAARILSIDRGGIRGVIPLTMIRQIMLRLGNFGLPLADYFDFACGTSAGTSLLLHFLPLKVELMSVRRSHCARDD